MKILAIRGRNLASLENEFEVDFTIEPLLSAGIFAITGSTGSGKSTLLDAICLALYNDTPRFNRAADNADITDVKNHTLKQKDSRNILRRGTAEGYAEVDFISLAGERIRARWSVRRSRDKIDGSIQRIVYRVFNLSSSEELQGGNVELLAKVKELIGLTFEQFTRAVLLAQGDFATFLKAAPKDKAELLEKLTGTDIYSRISSKIYENTKQSEIELSHLTERIKDVELLSPEQLDILTAEKESICSTNKILNDELIILSQKIEWIGINTQLNKDIANALALLEQSTVAIEMAKPRIEHLAQIDSVQQIRDDFKRLQLERAQLKKNEEQAEQQKEIVKRNDELITTATADFEKLKATKIKFTEELLAIEPQIKEARKLDVQITELLKTAKEIDDEVKSIIDSTIKYKETSDKSTAQIPIITKEQEEIINWFETHNTYNEIIKRVDFLKNCIADSKLYKSQISTKEQLYKDTEKSIEEDKKLLVEQEAEQIRLNTILPTEIAILREKLQDNEPCPVCGSTHHPISTLTVESLEEQALNKNKEIVLKEIGRLTIKISKQNEELLSIDASITNSKESYKNTFDRLIEKVSLIPNWAEKYEDNTLTNHILTIAKQWEINLAQQTKLAETLTLCKQAIINSNEQLSDATKQLEAKTIKQGYYNDRLKDLKLIRHRLLDGKNVDEVEKILKTKSKTVEDNYNNATEKLNLLVTKNKTLSGAISQLKSSITQLTTSTQEINAKIIEWISNREDNLSIDALTSLLSVSNDWLNKERESLTALHNNILSSKTTLLERERVAIEHQKANVKPIEGETHELLSITLQEKEILFSENKKRDIHIDVQLANHKSGKERIKSIEKELAVKNEYTENWKKLNDLFGSADGSKFKVLAQGYTLDVLLGYANKHLKDISQRYLLERVSPDSLSLQVVDLDMLSEVRSVHSLSGGESFLISLSLALGLSSLSSNRMSVESLFIDEGFGTLDADTLRVAMDALERLQTQGRKIGVISHVAEMTERIYTQIRVVKTTNGRSTIEIV